MSKRKPSVLVYGPAASGKTRYARQIAKHFGLTHIVDEVRTGGNFYSEGSLYLTNQRTEMVRAELCGLEVHEIGHVLQMMGFDK